MPSRHSKNAGDRHHFTYTEKKKAGLGSVTQRLGTESQLPFGYCCLSNQPAVDPVVSPSGHVYSREYIVEYLLTKSKELAKLREEFHIQQMKEQEEIELKNELDKTNKELLFKNTQDSMIINNKRKFSNNEYSYKESRKKIIDDTEDSERMKHLEKISPWVPQFTPSAEASKLSEPPKRPPSPFSGQPLRSKDLISIELIKESDGDNNSSINRYLCPVTRKTITNQKVIVLKNTGIYMLEQAAKDLAYPTMTCPITGKKINENNIIILKSAASGFSASGNVQTKIHKPTFN